ncbi:hypothetical protein GE21DRAFT_8672 [Neurospora crassa]|uniref:Uncharacterized protein n=1 Tax=Neurospora crassa (strain ATCC 24698 / 74-OR23-1A / CBS 708.71 / DSM 1257 / FGSC 987) TaxID=367110 RepID=Q7S656_NEUCR|nr:hypothetical protein NCU04704 [Neurospora crassa OR74A]EAA30999.3 hypothetical protein NCU04704 [Neurospora crassa OR74A]KHE83277.1 hypothetical protein GE21DRAFT_8672 [Neurospora crassa]|eukprot:XP_960235.3 hypothetical protein NCU04704 [Neurospora crassa OR74A]
MRPNENADVSTLQLHAVAVRRGDLASPGTTDATQLNLIMAREGICATIFIALHLYTTQRTIKDFNAFQSALNRMVPFLQPRSFELPKPESFFPRRDGTLDQGNQPSCGRWVAVLIVGFNSLFERPETGAT